MFTKLHSLDIPPTTISQEGYSPSLLRGTKGNRHSEKNYPKFVSFLLTKLPPKNTSHQGFSLLECLIGIAIIALVISAITPPIFLAVGTRVQNRRAEQALQLAQGEVDRVRRIVETGNYSDTVLPESTAPNDSPKSQGAPGSVVDPPTIPTANQAVSIDVNGDGKSDFFIQTYRTPGVRNSDNQLMAFGMGVRVYAFSAKENLDKLETATASLRMSTALGQQKRRPLAVIYSNVVRSDTGVSLQCYQEFLGSSNFKCK